MQHYLSKFIHCPACGSARFEEHDFKSKRCRDCGFTYYFNAAAACVAIIENERGQLLVARRGEEPARGTLDLIGGFVDPGESCEQAICREIEEETGHHLSADELGSDGLHILFTQPNTYLFSGLTVHTCDAFFHIRIPADTPLHAHDDVAACWWADPRELRLEDFGLDSVRNGLRRFLHSRPDN